MPKQNRCQFDFVVVIIWDREENMHPSNNKIFHQSSSGYPPHLPFRDPPVRIIGNNFPWRIDAICQDARNRNDFGHRLVRLFADFFS